MRSVERLILPWMSQPRLWRGDKEDMRIVDIVPHVLSTPLEEPFSFSQGWIDRRSTMIVEVSTDEGVTGWGESLCHGLQPPEVAASFVEFCFKPMLIGRDPFDVEVLWEEMYNRTRPFGGGAAVNAMSGVDIALWDTIGRYLDRPVHKLLGGAFRSEGEAWRSQAYWKNLCR